MFYSEAQQREEEDYFPQSSMEQAYVGDVEMARITKVNRNKVSELNAKGFYVVLGFMSVYGMDTDAHLGVSEVIELVTKAKVEAEAKAEDSWDDLWYEVFSPEVN